MKATPPAGAGTSPSVDLRSVSCASPGNCSAVGTYFDSAAHQQGLLLSQRATTTPPGPPSLSGLNLSHRKVSSAGRLVKGRCVTPTGKNRNHAHCTRKIKLKLTYTLNTPASVKLVLTGQLPGRKIKGRCVKPTRKNRHHKSCKRLNAVGTISHSSTAGANTFTINRKLAPGTYMLVVTASADGRTSSPTTISFTVTR